MDYYRQGVECVCGGAGGGGGAMTATSTFTQLLKSERPRVQCCFTSTEAVKLWMDYWGRSQQRP